jgi:uncharacterized protein
MATTATRVLARTGLALGGAAIGAVALLAGVGVSVARIVVTPPRRKRDDVRILALESDGSRVTLEATAETVVPGRYGFWFARNAGFARLGDIVEGDGETVTRIVEGVVEGDLAAATSGRWSGWVHRSPDDLGVDAADVDILTPVGWAPAWRIEPPATARAEHGDDRWAILVHGRGVTRSETVRAIPTFLADGRTVLAVSYRNDGEAPDSRDGRYALGAREWVDVDAALAYARSEGARDVVLMGWSMGGQTVLQTATASTHAELVSGVALDSPAVDWRDIIDHQVVGVRRLPLLLARVARAVLGSAPASRLAGLSAPLDFDALDFVRRADELEVPVLVLHSDADDFVPSGPSRRLAAARPDLVTLERFGTAKHTRLWNVETERWTGALAGWLAALPRR